jgi:Nuclease-related domain
MRILQQSPSLLTAFRKRIDAKTDAQRKELDTDLRNSFISTIAGLSFELDRATKQFQGNMGEWGVSLLLQFLSDEWIMFNNALIPTDNTGSLTEIDLLILGKNGIFLIEVKTWKGSFSAYKDSWKRRQGNSWIAIDNSPTSRSNYHQQMFKRWISSLVPNLPDNSISAPVIFPIAKWVGVQNCSVPVLQNIHTLISMIINSPECLTSMQVKLISEAIENYKISDSLQENKHRCNPPNLKSRVDNVK